MWLTLLCLGVANFGRHQFNKLSHHQRAQNPARFPQASQRLATSSGYLGSSPNCSSLPQQGQPTCWDDDQACVYLCTDTAKVGPGCGRYCSSKVCCTPDVPIAQTPQTELEAWKHLYTSLSGNGWLSCASDPTNPCACAGYVGCDPKSGQIVSLFFDAIGITGTLPPEGIAPLTALQSLAITVGFGDTLSGTVPSEIGSLTDLRYLSISGAATISGTLPSTLGKLRKLSALTIGTSDDDTWPLSGTLPTELADLGAAAPTDVGLLRVELGPNRISGTISAGVIAGWASGKLSGNLLVSGAPEDEGDIDWGLALSGSLPTELGLLVQLQDLELSNLRYVSGTLPTQLGSMSAMNDGLLLSALAVSGTMPTHLGRLGQLTQWVIGDLRMSGTLPSELAAVDQMQLFQYATRRGRAL